MWEGSYDTALTTDDSVFSVGKIALNITNKYFSLALTVTPSVCRYLSIVRAYIFLYTFINL